MGPNEDASELVRGDEDKELSKESPNVESPKEEESVIEKIGTTEYDISKKEDVERMAKDYKGGYDRFQKDATEVADLKRYVAMVEEAETPEEVEKVAEVEKPPPPEGVKGEFAAMAKELGFVTNAQLEAAVSAAKAEAVAQVETVSETKRVQGILETVVKDCTKDTENYPGFDGIAVTREMLEGLGILHPGRTKEEVLDRVTTAYEHLMRKNPPGETPPKKKPAFQERPSIRESRITPPGKPTPKTDEERDSQLSEKVSELFTGPGGEEE